MLDVGELLREIQEMREGGYLSDAILRESVKTISKADDKYDWVGIYLLNPEENMLWLLNYIGEPTEHAQIAVGEGVCGTAVAEGKNQNVPDVTAIDNYLSCSPKTKSELVVLIRAGDEILGQIDIDSHTEAAFTEEDEEVIGMIADKLAEVLMAERECPPDRGKSTDGTYYPRAEPLCAHDGWYENIPGGPVPGRRDRSWVGLGPAPRRDHRPGQRCKGRGDPDNTPAPRPLGRGQRSEERRV